MYAELKKKKRQNRMYIVQGSSDISVREHDP